MTAPSVQSLFFGQAGRRLFGTYHPTGSAANDIALLICSPFGQEDLCAYRSLRQLAQAAAASNIPTLRFDYAGCGNSEGDEQSPDTLTAWLDSVVQACVTLRQLSGAKRVVLLGLRLGGMLATLAAARCPGVCDVIAIAPVVSGRAYLRELKALHLAGEAFKLAAGDPGQTSDLFESGGFVLSADTHAALSALDLLKLDAPPAPAMLLIDRDDLPGAARLAAHLQTLGVATTQIGMPGYADLMADPHLSITPPTLIPAVLRRIQQSGSQPAPTTPTAAPDHSAPSHHATALLSAGSGQHAGQVRESAVTVGANHAMFGILSAPGSPMPSGRAGLGVLMLNAGAIRLVGPSRLYVTLARQWANLGHTVLRLDLAGLGDSPPHPGSPDNVVYSDHALEDVAAALTYLRSQPGVDKVLILGLCSGAYHAFKSAVRDLNVDHVVVINPLTFFWKPGTSLESPTVAQLRVAQDLQRHRQSMRSTQAWLKLIRGGVSPQRLTKIITQSLGWAGNKAYLATARSLGLHLEDDLARELEHVAQRRIHQYFVFSEADPGLTLLNAFGGKAVSRLQQQQLLDITLIAKADHTFTLATPRQALHKALNDIIQRLS